MSSATLRCYPLAVDDDGGRLRDTLVKFGAPELERLILLRKLGWQDKALDGHFQHQRHVADNSDERTNYAWFNKMRTAFRELDTFAGFVPTQGPFRFLDLGCCPGGFSSYVLKKNQEATGVGISLPVEQGGHASLLEPTLRPRFELHFADMLYYTLHDTASYPAVARHQLRPLPDGLARQFDLVMLDGHQLRVYRGPSMQNAEWWDRQRLLVSQFVIALRAVALGGTLVVKMTHLEKENTASWLLFLDGVSSSLVTRKPRTIHANRGTFYVIARGVGLGRRGAELAEYSRQLEDLWYDISFGGDEQKGRPMDAQDYSGITTREEMMSSSGLKRLLELGRDSWVVQANALQQWFQRKNLL